MYNQEQLTRIEELAGFLMAIDDIAILTGIDEDQLRQEIANKHSKANKAYRLGKAKTVLDIKKQEVALAKLASPTAVENVAQYLTEMDTNEL